MTLLLVNHEMVGSQGIEPRMPEATDLQSAAVTNAARYPILAVPMGIEPIPAA